MADIGDAHLIGVERGETKRGGNRERRARSATRPGQLSVISGLAAGGAAPCAEAGAPQAERCRNTAARKDFQQHAASCHHPHQSGGRI